MKIKYDNPVRTNVTKEVKEEIDKYCEEKGIKISDFLRDAIEFYLKHNNKNKGETIIIHNPTMAYYLKKKGFAQVGIEENYNQPGRSVYIFDKTKDLLLAMSNYSNSNSNSEVNKNEISEPKDGGNSQ